MTVPPDAPFSGLLFVAVLFGTVVFLFVRAGRHEHRLLLRAGVVVGAFFGVVVQILAVALVSDLTCRDGGFLLRANGGVIVVSVTATSVLGLLALFWLAGDRAPGMAGRLAVIPPALLVPVAIVEVMATSLPLEDYCDGVRGVLHLRAALTLLVPLATIGLALVRYGASGTASRLPRSLVLGALVAVLAAQVPALADRVPPEPLACVTRRSLPIDRGALATADFDGDGSVDLAGIDPSGAVQVLHNDGSGTFTTRAGAGAPVLALFASLRDVVAADLDGNGHPDLAVLFTEGGAPGNNRNRAAVTVMLNDGRSFRPRSPLYLDDDAGRFRELAAGDLDGDGNAEVVVSQPDSALVLWDRDGQLALGLRLAAPPPANAFRFQSWRFALADADTDGRLDVIGWMSRGLDSPSYVAVHRNAGGRAFTGSVVATIDDYFSGVALADFDGDGDVDLVSNGSDRRLRALVNRGDGGFNETLRPRRTGAETMDAADVDGDGRPDLVLHVGFISDEVDEPGFLFVRLNRGNFEFSDAQRLAIPQGLLAVADFNGDGRADYLVDEFRSVDVLLSQDC